MQCIHAFKKIEKVTKRWGEREIGREKRAESDTLCNTNNIDI